MTRASRRITGGVLTRSRCLTSGDESRWATADDENLAIFDAHRLRDDRIYGTLDHHEREHRAGRDTLLTPCADWRVYKQSGASQLDRAWRTERHAQAAFIAADGVDDGKERRHATSHARDVMNTPRLCQDNALFALTRSTTLRPDAPLHDLTVPTARLEPLLDALALSESGKIVFPGERDCG